MKIAINFFSILTLLLIYSCGKYQEQEPPSGKQEFLASYTYPLCAESPNEKCYEQRVVKVLQILSPATAFIENISTKTAFLDCRYVSSFSEGQSVNNLLLMREGDYNITNAYGRTYSIPYYRCDVISPRDFSNTYIKEYTRLGNNK